MSMTKKLWVIIGILVLLSPLGLIIPALFGSGGAWGEWGIDEIASVSGFVPEGMEHLSDVWKAPLPDYTVPGQGEGIAQDSLGYIATGLIGIGATAGIAYIFARVMARREQDR